MDNAFQDACGAGGPLLICTEAPGETGPETRAFDLPFALVGRDPRADLRLDHREVSERHAYLQLVGGRLVCVDLGSRGGVYQGGVRQRVSYLERDRPMRIGPFRVRLVSGDAAHEGGDGADGPPVALELVHRSLRHTRYDLTGGLSLVGSASDCQIRLVDPSVSNYHCSLLKTLSGVWVVDLMGEGGVRVNGQHVGYARLGEGDTLQVGHSLIRFGPAGMAGKSLAPSPCRGPVTADPPERAPATTTTAPPKAEQTPDGPTVSPETAELVARVLEPLAERFGEIQEGMVADFGRARAALFEAFTSFQAEQAVLLERELDEIRKISRELRQLRDELRRQPRGRADGDEQAAHEGELAQTPHTRLGTATPGASRAIALVTPGVADAVDPCSPRSPHIYGGRVHPPHEGLRRDHEAGGVPELEEQAHAALCRRMVSLSGKPQGRWGKVRSILIGPLKVKPTPPSE